MIGPAAATRKARAVRQTVDGGMCRRRSENSIGALTALAAGTASTAIRAGWPGVFLRVMPPRECRDGQGGLGN